MRQFRKLPDRGDFESKNSKGETFEPVFLHEKKVIDKNYCLIKPKDLSFHFESKIVQVEII